MKMRDFRDSTGMHWVVWSTHPWSPQLVGKERAGWLTFVSPKSRRRLTPIPPDWEVASDQRLEMYCSTAPEVRPTPITGIDPVDSRG